MWVLAGDLPKIFDRFLRLPCRREYRPVITLEYLKPRIDVGRVVRSRFMGDVEIGAQECRTELCHKFFHRIFRVPEALAQYSVEPVGCTTPVRQFMEQNAIVGLCG